MLEEMRKRAKQSQGISECGGGIIIGSDRGKRKRKVVSEA
jgi:hypothetical protein